MASLGPVPDMMLDLFLGNQVGSTCSGEGDDAIECGMNAERGERVGGLGTLLYGPKVTRPPPPLTHSSTHYFVL
jgi:hypothetical protein